MFQMIKTMPQLKEAILSTYLYDLVIAIIFIVLLVVVASLIPWQGGKSDSSGRTRRVWYIVLGILNLVGTILFNFFAFCKKIGVPNFRSDYMLHMVLGAILFTVLYYGLLWLIIKIQKNSGKVTKLNSIASK